MKKTLMIITTMILSSSLWAKPDCTPVEILPAEISTVMTLDASKLYRVSGCVIVTETGTLNAPAGTVILFSNNDNIIFEPGSKVNFIGTAAEPVILTSVEEPGSRVSLTNAAMYIRGKDFLNESVLELPCGNTHFSGIEPNDNSGRLEHVRIEYLSGDPVLDYMNAAVNFIGVGSETVIKNLQVSYSGNNGVNALGGSFDLEKVFLLNNQKNNMFAALGNTSLITQMLSIQNDGSGENSLLVWNNPEDGPSNIAMPLTMPTVQNSSFIGVGLCEETKIGTGIKFEHNGGGDYRDLVFTGFDVGLFIEDELSAERTREPIVSPTLTVNYTSFTDNDTEYEYGSFIWATYGCGGSMNAWITGSIFGCGQLGNQFGVSPLGYDVSFCGEFCVENFKPDFVIDGNLTDLDEPSSNAAFDFRGAIQEDNLFTWTQVCPQMDTLCNPVPLQKTSQLEVYPNPATYMATVDIEVKSTQTVYVRVMEMVTGRVLYKTQIQVKEGKQSIDIPTQAWKEGVYNVQIQTNDGLLHGKLSVK